MNKPEKKYFLNNLGLLFSAREKVRNSFKSRLFPIKNVDKIPRREPTPKPATEPTAELAAEPTETTPKVATEPADATPTKHKKSKLKFQKNL